MLTFFSFQDVRFPLSLVKGYFLQEIENRFWFYPFKEWYKYFLKDVQELKHIEDIPLKVSKEIVFTYVCYTFVFKFTCTYLLTWLHAAIVR